jgi:hypothetical protein
MCNNYSRFFSRLQAFSKNGPVHEPGGCGREAEDHDESEKTP